MQFLKLTREFFKDEDGATAVEYGLIAILISVALISSIIVMRDDLIALFEFIASTLGG